MIHVVIGTKAQLIKMAPILYHLQKQNIPYNYISTGQHKAKIDDILSNFGLRQPDYAICEADDITSIKKMMTWSVTILWRTLRNKKEIFADDKEGMVLVHGDTLSTLLGAIMGRIAGLKVGHVESGLRSFNLFQPFPEEITRLMTFSLANYYFCPDNRAIQNLKRYSGEKINTGANTLYDSLRLSNNFPDVLPQTEIPSRQYSIVTLHRHENIYRQDALERVMGLVEEISKTRYLLFILHKPTEKKIHQFNWYQRLQENPNIELRERYDYFGFIQLIKSAEFVVSDGGSNQEECYYLGMPIILLREVTERHDGLGENCLLSGYSIEKIIEFISTIDDHQFSFKELDVKPSEKIIESCLPFV
ncbi:MAG: UDP-N-acetylglucosamine 2-epimerase [Arenicellales bacterium]